MPKYLCLRDCFVDSRLFIRDVVYDLTDGFKCEHLELIRGEVEGDPEQPPEPEEIIKCSVCGRECKSEFGLRSHMRSHLKINI